MASTGSSIYVKLASIPLPTSAQFISKDVIQTSFSTRDHTRNVKLPTTKSFFIAPTSVTRGPAQDAAGVVSSLASPTGTRRAVLRESTDKKRYVEIWKDELLEASQDVTEKHGVCYNDDYLSSLSFSPSETKLVYTAELNAPTGSAKFEFRPTFGEGLSGRKAPTLYVFDFANAGKSTVTPLDISCSSGEEAGKVSTHFGQATFASETRVFAIGYQTTPAGRILGPKGCYNHQSSLWDLSLELLDSKPAPANPGEEPKNIQVTAKRLTDGSRSARSPRVFFNKGKADTLIWVSELSFGGHAGCAQLRTLDLRASSNAAPAEKILVDTVFDPSDTTTATNSSLEGFPGLYLDPVLPSRPFLTLNDQSSPYLITHSVWGSRTTVLAVSVRTGRVVNLTFNGEHAEYSYAVLGTDGQDRVVCSRSKPGVPHEVVFGTVNFTGGSGVSSVEWRVLWKAAVGEEFQKALDSIKTSIIPIPNRFPAETIVLQPTSTTPNSEVLPCVTTPHGGPHATTLVAFSPATAALVLSGYTVSLPNYTGSLGFGEKYVQKLLGQCGSLDVEDCIASVQHLIDIGISKEGKGMQFIQGGSHGGFLTGHLIGQYPDTFTAAVLRNPVISMGEISTSDIPDWYYLEAGFGLDPNAPDAYSPATTIMTPSLYAALFAASPLAHVDKVTAEVLLHVGEADERVSPTQGYNYYYALKGRGRGKVRLLAFPGESHPLEGVEAGRVSWETGVELFEGLRRK